MAKILLFFLSALSVAVVAQSRYVDLDDVDESSLQSFFSDRDVIVVGEMHGTQEVPDVVYRLAEMLSKDGKPFTVALEQPVDMQEGIDLYMQTGKLERLLSHDFFEIADGRSSKAMLNLLSRLRTLKRIRVLCFDIPYGLGDVDRDSIMGVNLDAGYKTDRMVVLTGNYHATLEPARGGSVVPESAVYHFNKMRSLADRILVLQTYFNSGTIWNCMDDGCKERKAYSNPGVTIPDGLRNFIGIDDLSGETGYIFFDRVTASTPAGKTE